MASNLLLKIKREIGTRFVVSDVDGVPKTHTTMVHDVVITVKRMAVTTMRHH